MTRKYSDYLLTIVVVSMIIGLSVWFFTNLTYTRGYCDGKADAVQEATQDTVYLPETKPEFHEDSLISFIKALNLKHPEVIVAQARLETGNYTSKVFRENNNLFGMKCSSSRPHTYIGKKNGHAEYASWQESVYDYALYQASFLRKKSRSEYIEYLNRNYSGIGDLYGERINAIINTLEHEIL